MSHEKINKDCLEALAAMPEGCIDVVIVEPNYNYDKWPSFISAVIRALKESGRVVFTRCQKTARIPDPDQDPGEEKTRYLPSNYHKAFEEYFNVKKITSWTDRRKQVPVVIDFYLAWLQDRPAAGKVYKPLKASYSDPMLQAKASIPGVMLERIVEATTRKTDQIVDPMAGYGNIAQACLALGRRNIGSIEIEPVFFKYLQQVR